VTLCLLSLFISFPTSAECDKSKKKKMYRQIQQQAEKNIEKNIPQSYSGTKNSTKARGVPATGAIKRGETEGGLEKQQQNSDLEAVDGEVLAPKSAPVAAC
jgi:uncharacterized protein YktB (UPF0637 family)